MHQIDGAFRCVELLPGYSTDKSGHLSQGHYLLEYVVAQKRIQAALCDDIDATTQFSLQFRDQTCRKP